MTRPFGTVLNLLIVLRTLSLSEQIPCAGDFKFHRNILRVGSFEFERKLPCGGDFAFE